MINEVCTYMTVPKIDRAWPSSSSGGKLIAYTVRDIETACKRDLQVSIISQSEVSSPPKGKWYTFAHHPQVASN